MGFNLRMATRSAPVLRNTRQRIALPLSEEGPALITGTPKSFHRLYAVGPRATPSTGSVWSLEYGKLISGLVSFYTLEQNT